MRKLEASLDMPAEAFPPPSGHNAPEQVHITQGDRNGKGVIISWLTPLSPKPNVVRYWAADSDEEHDHKVRSRITTYKYYNYTSGYIHHATINDLQYDTKYFYEIGSGDATRRFFFTTPPMVGPDVPYIFGIIGDLGQTYDSNQTFEHYYSNSKGQAVLFVGDLSYADNHPFHDNRKWDTWGRFVEKSTAYQPWIWTAGNHEMDFAPEIGENTPFKPFTHRYHVPYKTAQSSSPLWYSIKRASAYIIVLSSYSAYGTYTPQYQWLQNEFTKVNREETPWLIVMVHSPWYNSYNYHYMEGESMRVMFESWFVENKVDLVLSGHVHAYERSERVSNVRYNITNRLSSPIRDINAPMYITIGDGGNIEGLANQFTEPQPNYSAFREASFGHALLEIKNRTHAYYTWHRNHDNEPVAADSLWIYNRFWYPEEITVTSGCTEAIAATMLGLINPGDEVILFAPFYDSYEATLSMAGAKIKCITLRPPDFSLPINEFRSAISKDTRAVLINTPHNPTGKMFTRDELNEIASLCIENDVLVFADEVYDKLSFEMDHISIASLPGMFERTVTMNSLGKTFSLTGWKIGWAIAPPHLTWGVRQAHAFLTFATSTPMQSAAATALRAPESYYEELKKDYLSKKAILEEGLKAVGFKVFPSSGTYFIIVDHTPFGLKNDVDFCEYLIKEVGVVAIPTSVFYLNPEDGKDLVRFTFCKDENTLRAAVERMKEKLTRKS